MQVLLSPVLLELQHSIVDLQKLQWFFSHSKTEPMYNISDLIDELKHLQVKEIMR